MNRERAELVLRIGEFQFDDPHAERPFSARLAQEQAWSREFAARAIEEYRRFAVLATAAGHPVCPSKVVDEVWHLHLLYTQNYWKRFCGEVLKRPLHHEPSRGGGAEFDKHREMYAQTLQSYRAIFGEEPPADIWPPVDAVFSEFFPPMWRSGRKKQFAIAIASSTALAMGRKRRSPFGASAIQPRSVRTAWGLTGFARAGFPFALRCVVLRCDERGVVYAVAGTSGGPSTRNEHTEARCL